MSNRRALILALLDDREDLRDLYLNSPEFYHGINGLAAMLPAFVVGLESIAAQRGTARDELREELLKRGMIR